MSCTDVRREQLATILLGSEGWGGCQYSLFIQNNSLAGNQYVNPLAPVFPFKF